MKQSNMLHRTHTELFTFSIGIPNNQISHERELFQAYKSFYKVSSFKIKFLFKKRGYLDSVNTPYT